METVSVKEKNLFTVREDCKWHSNSFFFFFVCLKLVKYVLTEKLIHELSLTLYFRFTVEIHAYMHI